MDVSPVSRWSLESQSYSLDVQQVASVLNRYTSKAMRYVAWAIAIPVAAAGLFFVVLSLSGSGALAALIGLPILLLAGWILWSNSRTWRTLLILGKEPKRSSIVFGPVRMVATDIDVAWISDHGEYRVPWDCVLQIDRVEGFAAIKLMQGWLVVPSTELDIEALIQQWERRRPARV